ncbi:RNA-binding protein 43 [Sebastes fasciatus]|uniref:RNA-binding protein 43 n=1 Tax=Sebastes fasciatus TaxID=394691 RepID=UPI003D9F5B5F
MDLLVEATVQLDIFHDEAAVREILRSHGFTVTDLSSNRVRVKGSFLELKAVKASLEQLLNSQTKTDITAVPKVSYSGAVSKYYTSNSSVSHGNRGGRDEPPHASPSPPTTSSSSNRLPTSDQRGSSRPGRESFVVDADVFRYAERLRKKDIEGILDSHNVKMETHEVGDSFNINLQGKSARTAAFKLQSLMNDLNKSLRTQEVPLKDMDREGQALLQRIRKDKNICNSVLVCPMNDKLHLIGPSSESYELKQRLLGRPAGRTGRTSDRNPNRRSNSLPPIGRKNTGRDSGAAAAKPPPNGAAGYSPSKYQDDEQKAAEPKRGFAARLGLGGSLRGRSRSETRTKTQAERVNVQEVENKHPPPNSPMKGMKQLLSVKTKDIGKKFKFLRKR